MHLRCRSSGRSAPPLVFVARRRREPRLLGKAQIHEFRHVDHSNAPRHARGPMDALYLAFFRNCWPARSCVPKCIFRCPCRAPRSRRCCSFFSFSGISRPRRSSFISSFSLVVKAPYDTHICKGLVLWLNQFAGRRSEASNSASIATATTIWTNRKASRFAKRCKPARRIRASSTPSKTRRRWEPACCARTASA